MTAIKAEQAVSIKEEKATMSLRQSFDHQWVVDKSPSIKIAWFQNSQKSSLFSGIGGAMGLVLGLRYLKSILCALINRLW